MAIQKLYNFQIIVIIFFIIGLHLMKSIIRLETLVEDDQNELVEKQVTKLTVESVNNPNIEIPEPRSLDVHETLFMNRWQNLVGNQAFSEMEEITKMGIVYQIENENKIQPKTKHWLIIAFTNLNYLDVAKIWYNQLTSLGYTSHILIALDEATFEALEETEYRTKRAHSEFFFNDKGLHDLWLLRWKTVLGLMNQGYNVFLNDADSIWKRKVELNSVFSEETDITHVYDRAYPRAVYDVQRFTLGGGTVAYSNTDLTKSLLKMWIDQCELRANGCDDQDTMNRYYLKQGVVWSPKSEMSKHEQMFNRTGLVYDNDSEINGLRVSVVYDGLIYRGNQAKLCNERNVEKPDLWIFNSQASKDGDSKMEMLKKFKNCYTEEIRDEYFD